MFFTFTMLRYDEPDFKDMMMTVIIKRNAAAPATLPAPVKPAPKTAPPQREQPFHVPSHPFTRPPGIKPGEKIEPKGHHYGA